ncbi:hypothetical protein X753_21180 [Mesorhizobium sp. LNJC399B00]|nr:hypothetical protein X753_21180 [Mesorhizobium sp. LNJC399B00]ESZ35090.1 hypothetical protein X732_25605 [Mesorhizobium sp. L2C066B000]
MDLYHFTAGQCLRGIAAHGLTVGDVPTDLWRGTGLVGVWLTSSKVEIGHGLAGSALDKARFRLKVDVPEADLHKWRVWAATNGTQETVDALRRANGSSDRTWFIYFGRVSPDRIVQVVDLATSSVVSDWQNCWPVANSRPGVRFEDRFSWHERLLQNVRSKVQ